MILEKIYQTITDYDKEVPHTVNELNLPLLKVNLSRNDVAHFFDLYEKYNKEDINHLYPS